MSKKGAATKESVNEAVQRLDKDQDKASEADFKILLKAANGDDEQKKIAASYIPYFFDKFPKQQKESLKAILELSKSEDDQVRLNAVRNLKKFYNYDKDQVAKALINSLGDSVEAIDANATEFFTRSLKTDEDLKKTFFDCLAGAKDEAQVRMVQIIRDNIEFTEENSEQLLSVLKASFKTCLIEGLSLYRKNRKLLNEEQMQPLVDELFERLENSLQSENFKAVAENLLVPIFKFTKALGNTATSRLLSIIAKYVIPKFDELESKNKIDVIRKVADVSRLAEDDLLLRNIYEKIFLKFPTENSGSINFSIIEATLFAFIHLARKFNSTASELIGTTLCYTGQPGEADGDNENEERNAEFRKRIQYISSVAPDFVDSYEGKINALKNQETKNDEERKRQSEDVREAIRAKRTGNNVRHLSRLLLSSNPLSGKLPQSPSWKSIKNDRKFSSNRGSSRNQRNVRGRTNSFNNRNNVRNNRSRNGGRFSNNNSNRQGRGRFSNNNRR